jgi:nucleoside 2-deoxyribosyltransferase
MKAYLAGRYARREEFKEVAERLRKEVGLEITSRWLHETEDVNSDMGDHSKEFYEATAQIDLEDVAAADVIIFFSEDPLEGWKRGGRHVEFGYALALGKTICVIGPRENVFHYTPKVANFFSIDHYIQAYTDQMKFILGLVRQQYGEDAMKISKKKLGAEWVTDVPVLELQEKGGDESNSFGG